VFAYLSHSTQYAGTRILSFLGECDESFNCSWPAEGQGQYDHSADFIASQSFDDPRGRRVLIGWVGGPHGSKFTGAQSIPRMIVADSGGPLRFLPLPELTSLHTNSHNFSEQFSGHKSTTRPVKDSSRSGQGDAEQDTQLQAVWPKQQHATDSRILVTSTTNSYHLNVSFDVSKLETHSLTPGNASIELRAFVPRTDSGDVQTDTDGLAVFTLRPPWSYEAQKPLKATSVVGNILVCTSCIERI
jgi:sucrose-6-phosphate hydrolase SacC (GH32 family)